MHGPSFLQDLAVVMIVAAIVSVTFRQLHLPVVLGYIIAGLIIGPYTPPYPLVSDAATIQTLADLGVVFMMLSLGLEFDLRKLRRVGLPALIAALLEIPLMLFLGYTIGGAFGWRAMDSLFLGAVVSISSTTIIVKTFGELKLRSDKFIEVVFGILIFEDILAVLMLALLSTIAMTGSFQIDAVAKTMGRLGLFLSISLVLGFIAIPRLLGYVARFKSNEMLLVAVLGLSFGLALLAVKLGFSAALGAFVIGAIVAESQQHGRVEILTEPIRDMFGAVFFVAIGLLINPALLFEQKWTILAVSAAVIGGKIVACTLGTLVAGHDRRTALRVGMSMANIGEFSFIIAGLGVTLGVTNAGLYPIAVMVSVITTLLTPFLIRFSDGMVRFMDRISPKGLVQFLDLYSDWIAASLGPSGHSIAPGATAGPRAQPLLRRAAVNLTLIASVFVAAAFLARRFNPALPAWLPNWPTLLWLAAAATSLPLFIGTVRKLWLIARIIGDSTASFAGARVVITSIVFGGSMLALIFITMLLSATILPPLKLLLGMMVLLALSAVLFRHRIGSMYGKIQDVVQESLEGPPPRKHGTSTGLQKALPSLLEAAKFEKVILLDGTTAVGRMLEELKLRSRTGASVVAIERGDELIVNPAPDVPLAAGDRVLILGTVDQVGAARELLEGRLDA
jgi:monovalent cation:H+ antiporter-2, CPA2 family